MQLPPEFVPVVLILTVSGLLIVTGLRKQPGIGVLAAVLLVAATLRLRGEGPDAIGFSFPEDWSAAVLRGLGYGVLLQILAAVFVGPLSEKITGTVHDHSIFDGIRGNWKALFLWLAMVWTLVAVLEEGIFRGFLMTEIAKVVGTGPAGLVFNVLFTSAVFGLSHGYQNLSGVVTAGTIGLLLGCIFISSGFNLWQAIFTHGFVDTVGIVVIFSGCDRHIEYFVRRKIWRGRI
jgi:hypothetical protein